MLKNSFKSSCEKVNDNAQVPARKVDCHFSVTKGVNCIIDTVKCDVINNVLRFVLLKLSGNIVSVFET